MFRKNCKVFINFDFLIFFTRTKINNAVNKIKTIRVKALGALVENFQKGQTKAKEIKAHPAIIRINFRNDIKPFFKLILINKKMSLKNI